MANSENAFVLGLQVSWHVHMVTICMRAAGPSSRATHTQHLLLNAGNSMTT
jgi:hypothetical protein